MALKSAYDDLQDRTLSRIRGALRQLGYVAGTRSPDGQYEHWGFERIHGAGITQSTFARAHRALLDTVLRTRLSILEKDLSPFSGEDEEFTRRFAGLSRSESLPSLLPPSCPEWSRAHLWSIVQTLAALEAQAAADRRSSSRHRPPAR